jgi:hypothetical protein
MLVEKKKELELEKQNIHIFKLEIQMKNFQREKIQLSLNQAQTELDKLRRQINQLKFRDTSYMSTQYDDY